MRKADISYRQHARMVVAAPYVYEALKSVEWSALRYTGISTPYKPICAKCRHSEDEGHHDDCKVGKAIKMCEG